MAGDDLEPIDLESIDIEPVDLEPGDAKAAATHRPERPRLDPERARRPGWIWVGLATAGCAVWATVASGTHRPRPHPSTTPTTPTTAANWVTPTSLPVDRLATLESRLWSTLGDVGSGRFAVVVDGRLYLLDAVPGHAEATPVGLPYGDVRIDEQGGGVSGLDVAADVGLHDAGPDGHLVGERHPTQGGRTPAVVAPP